MLYIVYSYSSRSYCWPLSVDEMVTHTNTMLEEADGIESTLECKNLLNSR